MLRLPPIELRRPATVAEAAAILAAEGPRARVVAGGTDLWPNLKRRHQKAEVVVSIGAIDALRGVEAESGDARIGAGVTLSAALADPALRARYPALARALAAISSPPLRNMGTVGGNLCVDTRCTYYNQTEEWRRAIGYCMKEAGEICWVATSSPRCWAHTAGDSAPILTALDARATLAGSAGERAIAVDDLFADDGIDYLAKAADEIVIAIEVPEASDSTHCRSAFWKLRRRGTIDFAVLSVAAVAWCAADGTVERAALVLGAVGSRPLRVVDAEQRLVGTKLDEDSIAEAAKIAHKTARPMDNTDFVPAWRGRMVERYVTAALREVAGREPGITSPRHLAVA